MIGEHSKAERPAPLASKAVRGVDEPRMLRFLLAQSVKRLKAARKLEESRKIVYPETTCIVRDVERLTRRLNEMLSGDETSSAVAKPPVDVPVPVVDDVWNVEGIE